MAGGAFEMQNQLQFNLGIPLASSNLAVRYHKPNPIVVERAGGVAKTGGVANMPPQRSEPAPLDQSSVMEDRMALAVRLAQRDLKKQRESEASSVPARSRAPPPRGVRSNVTRGGTRVVHTREAEERAARLQAKRENQSYMRTREHGWNSGTTAAARTQTPPRDRQARLPVTTNSPPTRDTDRYPAPRAGPSGLLDDPSHEIDRLQREMETYLQQIQVIEQRAMKEDPADIGAAPKTRRRDGYLDDEEDPARRALRQEEQTVRAARQLYNLRQQVCTLQEHVTRAQGRKIKHTKKSQVMLRLAAAHRGAVRAIQSFVQQQLPDRDLRRGLPQAYGELALLIRQLALISTQIRTTGGDAKPAHDDLIKMLDKVDELNKAWCEEMITKTRQENVEEGLPERRRKSPLGRQVEQAPPARGRQPSSLQHRAAGKENRPKGLLKKQYNRPASGGVQKSHRTRQVTPERQRALQAGIEALMRGRNQATVSHGSSGMAWDVSANNNSTGEPADRSVILGRPLQHKREKAQKSVVLAVPDSHFTDPTLASSLKAVNLDDKDGAQREPWRPSGSGPQSPSRRSKSRERARSQERARSRDRSRLQDESRSQGRSQERSRSRSPRIPRSCLLQDMDEELMRELFPQGVDGQGRRSRSASPSPRSPSSRSRSPRQRSRSPHRYGQPTAYNLQNHLRRLDRGAEDERMIRERQQETSEISRRGLMEDQAASGRGGDVADLLLEDLVAEAANELTNLEHGDRLSRQARRRQNDPSLENMYQRLEQMELEQEDIRRRWGTIKFEESTAPRASHSARQIDGPSGPTAMRITRQDPAQSHRVQASRGYDKEQDEPIIFTKSTPVARYEHQTVPVEDASQGQADYDGFRLRVSHLTRLKVSDSLVREVQSNVEKYERHLRKTSHHTQGRFDPWTFVEEIADQVLEECLREIDSELDEIGENIVHQLCKAEFAVPESQAAAQDSTDNVVDYESDGLDRDLHPGPADNALNLTAEPARIQTFPQPATRQKEVSIAVPRKTEPDFEPESDRYVYSSIDASEQTSVNKSVDKTAPTASKKEVSFNQEISYEKEAIFDAADLDTARDSYGYEDNVEDYEDDEYDDDDDDDDDDVEEVSPIDSDDLEYSTDET